MVTPDGGEIRVDEGMRRWWQEEPWGADALRARYGLTEEMTTKTYDWVTKQKAAATAGGVASAGSGGGGRVRGGSTWGDAERGGGCGDV